MFWKVPSRKLYAVRKEDLRKPSSKRKYPSDGQEQDRCTNEDHANYNAVQSKLTDVSGIIQGMSSKIEIIHTFVAREGSLDSALQQFLKCKICFTSPAELPLYVSSCCEIIIGCASCVQRWLEEDEDRGCPHCRAGRFDMSPVKLKGLENIIQLMHRV